MGSLRRLWWALLDILYPRHCAGCGGAVQAPQGHLCWECLAGLEVITQPFCARCGDPVDGAVYHEYVCTLCQRRRVWFDAARSAARYRGALKQAVRALKYHASVHLLHDCATLLESCVRTYYASILFDAVTHVPLHPRRERQRTYNQSDLLARVLARRLGLHGAPGVLRRVAFAPSQTRLTASQRRRNVRGTFAARETEWVRGRTFLLVDDVMTTGATVNECARVLKEAGAAAVYVVTVARG